MRITIQQSEGIKRQVDSGLYSSESDFVRQALNIVLKKSDPPYKRPSLREREKVATMMEEDEKARMTDVEYVKRYIKDVCVFTDRKGIQFLAHRMMSYSMGIVPLARVKAWAKEKDWNFNFSQKAKLENPDLKTWEENFRYQGTRSELVTFWDVDIDPKEELKFDFITD